MTNISLDGLGTTRFLELIMRPNEECKRVDGPSRGHDDEDDDRQMNGRTKRWGNGRARSALSGGQRLLLFFLTLQPHTRILTSRHLFPCMLMIPPSLVEEVEQMDGFEVPLLRLARCQGGAVLDAVTDTRIGCDPTPGLSCNWTDSFHLFLWDILRRGLCNAWNRKRQEFIFLNRN